MPARISQRIIVDTGYIYALFEKKDPSHVAAMDKVGYLDRAQVLIPWPILYETINTRFVKRNGFGHIARLLNRPNVHKIDDRDYRAEALTTLPDAILQGRNFSLCDMVLRLLIDDVNLQVNGILTFNEKDFVDICRARQVEVL